MCVCVCVCVYIYIYIKASFIKDDGIMIIIFYCNFSSLLLIFLVLGRIITRTLEKLQLKRLNRVPSSLVKLALITTCYLNIHSSKEKMYIY